MIRQDWRHTLFSTSRLNLGKTFCHHYHQNYHRNHHKYLATILIIIRLVFCHTFNFFIFRIFLVVLTPADLWYHSRLRDIGTWRFLWRTDVQDVQELGIQVVGFQKVELLAPTHLFCWNGDSIQSKMWNYWNMCKLQLHYDAEFRNGAQWGAMWCNVQCAMCNVVQATNKQTAGDCGNSWHTPNNVGPTFCACKNISNLLLKIEEKLQTYIFSRFWLPGWLFLFKVNFWRFVYLFQVQ